MGMRCYSAVLGARWGEKSPSDAAPDVEDITISWETRESCGPSWQDLSGVVLYLNMVLYCVDHLYLEALGLVRNHDDPLRSQALASRSRHSSCVRAILLRSLLLRTLSTHCAFGLNVIDLQIQFHKLTIRDVIPSEQHAGHLNNTTTLPPLTTRRPSDEMAD